jgi:hypothetical protein
MCLFIGSDRAAETIHKEDTQRRYTKVGFRD